MFANIEEALIAAENLGIKDKVLEQAKELREQLRKRRMPISQLEAYERTYIELTKNK